MTGQFNKVVCDFVEFQRLISRNFRPLPRTEKVLGVKMNFLSANIYLKRAAKSADNGFMKRTIQTIAQNSK